MKAVISKKQATTHDLNRECKEQRGSIESLYIPLGGIPKDVDETHLCWHGAPFGQLPKKHQTLSFASMFCPTLLVSFMTQLGKVMKQLFGSAFKGRRVNLVQIQNNNITFLGKYLGGSLLIMKKRNKHQSLCCIFHLNILR